MTTSNTSPLRYLASYTSAPAFRAFSDYPALSDILAELEDIAETDTVDAAALRADIATCRAAMAAEQAGETVLVARDEDGWYFAVRGPDVYRDADALTPCDCDELYRVRRHAHVEQYDCDGCGFTVVVEGEVSEADEGIEFTAGEWRVRCPGCGIVYVLTPAPILTVTLHEDNAGRLAVAQDGGLEAHIGLEAVAGASFAADAAALLAEGDGDWTTDRLPAAELETGSWRPVATYDNVAGVRVVGTPGTAARRYLGLERE